jgi:hypothetical protein
MKIEVKERKRKRKKKRNRKKSERNRGEMGGARYRPEKKKRANEMEGKE